MLDKRMDGRKGWGWLHKKYKVGSYLKTCFQQSDEWLPISNPVDIMASILNTWAACSLTNLDFDCERIEDFCDVLSVGDKVACLKSSITQEVLASSLNTPSHLSCKPEITKIWCLLFVSYRSLPWWNWKWLTFCHHYRTRPACIMCILTRLYTDKLEIPDS